ncbi:MAG TPA: hypothetical protein ENG87_04075 [Candidatus Pacearchaeota archaeon]|nr:hypothetical protein BMS3Abin17_00786 [archaeon BMS3Abin17]HDK42532.1 hypothetical protein [Candidatus Pacearchaeota archaeon]HDZ60553.1 hypothetical protein [Candidatus Pacearchaeota archaeon]
MKKLITLSVMALLVLPMVMAVSTGTGVGVDIETEDFAPLVWMCGARHVFDDATGPGRITGDGEVMWERSNNYAFEGEQIMWKILVMDKNGKEKIEDVFATIGDSQGEGNDIEVNCQREDWAYEKGIEQCNARIGEEEITEFEPETMEAYVCRLTVETPESMYGEYWITVEAVDLDGLSGTMDENEYWFLNPEVALSIEGDISFSEVRPGTSSYSETLLVGNDANDGSGVLLDMFISGTDFYDSSSSGAMCPTTNQLSLDTFSYYATHGAYATGGINWDPRALGPEGYVPINYGVGFNDPNPFYDVNEIMQSGPTDGNYYLANILSPGSEMALTFRLDLPEPCNGDFDTGSIYFWGEAI